MPIRKTNRTVQNYRVNACVTKREREVIKAAARAKGVSMSKYVTNAVMAAAHRDLSEEAGKYCN